MTLHVTNGDIVVDLLCWAGLATDALAWADVLHEGPVLDGWTTPGCAGPGPSSSSAPTAAAPPRRCAASPSATGLAGGRAGDYLLWFEADLYDQLQVAQILATLGDLGWTRPGHAGLHRRVPRHRPLRRPRRAEPEQLGGLLATAATPLTAEALGLGAAAWAALRAPDLGGLGQIVASRSPQLRFLSEAFDRLAREYPRPATACP